jgi:hypothetical protein
MYTYMPRIYFAEKSLFIISSKIKEVYMELYLDHKTREQGEDIEMRKGENNI